MRRFRQKPSSRRAASPVAKWLVCGPTLAGQVARGERTTHLIPMRPTDHRRRYHEQQRLSVKAFVGGATVCHVHVQGAERVQLRDIDYPTARELGRIHVTDLRVRWVEEHDAEWCKRWAEEWGVNAVTAWEDDALERFDRRHGHKWVWLIRFNVDRSDTGGLPAARSEEGYTDSPARALAEEMPAVRGLDWELHVGRPAREREAQRQQMILADRAALDTGQRVAYARHAAQAKGLDMRSEFRLYDRLTRLGRAVEAVRQLELIESRVFPQRTAA